MKQDQEVLPARGFFTRLRSLGAARLLAFATAAVLLVGAVIWFSYDLTQRRAMPEVIGMTADEARDALASEGLEPDISQADSVDGLKDINTVIVGQEPSAGAALRSGDEVSIEVDGREIQAPSIEGATYGEAWDAVRDWQGAVTHQFGDNLPPQEWRVADQITQSGSTIRAGDSIEVKLEAPEIVVPGFSGKDADEFEDELIGLGLNITTSGSGDRIAASDTKAGTRLEPFDRVELTRGFEVPDVKGKTRNEAEEILHMFSSVRFEGDRTRDISAQSVPAGQVLASSAELVVTSPDAETIYRILGNGSSAMVSWSAPNSFSIEQETAATLPWEKKFPGSTGTTVFNAQIMDGDSVTCQLERNGEVVQEKTSTGPYAVVQC